MTTEERFVKVAREAVEASERAVEDLRKTIAARDAQYLIILKLKDVVRTLVKFAAHDDACAKVQGEKRPDLVHPDLAKHCTCGLERLYGQIDALIED